MDASTDRQFTTPRLARLRPRRRYPLLPAGIVLLGACEWRTGEVLVTMAVLRAFSGTLGAAT